jgi:hypothetical protein
MVVCRRFKRRVRADFAGRTVNDDRPVSETAGRRLALVSGA